MRRRKLPPLNGLRAFDAAARHMSLTRAAEELHVTRPAVAQQVRKLEEHLGFALFVWAARPLTLTLAGEVLIRHLKDGFDQVETAVQKARNAFDRMTVTIHACPAFIAKWLVPRLKDFYARCSSIDIKICPSVDLPSLCSRGADLAIHYGSGVHSHFRTDILFGETLFPVVAPGLADHFGRIGTPDDLTHHALLHDGTLIPDGVLPGWGTWFKAAGISDISSLAGPTLSPSNVVIQAAIDGMGIALGRSALVGDDLTSGKLIRLLDLEVNSGCLYRLISLPSTDEPPSVGIFREWLLDVAAGEAPRQRTCCVDLVA